MQIKSHSFRSRKWRIIDAGQGNGGECHAPHIKGREMCIPVDGDSFHDLEICIHESLHALFWDLDEEVVEESGHDLARLLWRMGWRKD